MIRAIVLEDEQKGLENLFSICQAYCKEIQIVGVASSNEDAIKLLEDPELKPDVAFLDVNLKDGPVFRFLDKIQENGAKIQFELIFVTAYDHYAMKACQYSSIGYIMKPINPADFVEAVRRIRPTNLLKLNERLELFSTYAQNPNPNTFEKIYISATDGFYFFNLKDIVRLEGDDNYTYVYLNNNQKITSSKTIKYYEDMLSQHNFFRVHKKHIINLNYMRKYVRGEGGHVIMQDDKNIEVSRRKRPHFVAKLKMLQDGL